MSMTRYAPSGKFSAVGLIGMIFGGLLGAFIFGTVYIYLMNYFSNMVLRLIIIGGLIAGMSQWMIFLMRIGKIRRPVLAVGITALSLLFLLYSKWAVYVNMVQEIWKSTDKVWYANLAMPVSLRLGGIRLRTQWICGKPWWRSISAAFCW